jgi:hypothetical protein
MQACASSTCIPLVLWELFEDNMELSTAMASKTKVQQANTP